MNQKTVLEEIKTEIEQLHNSPGCRHCKNSTKAEKPFAEMTKFELTPLAKKVTHEFAKECGVNESCLVCLSLLNFKKKPFDEQMKSLSGEKA